MQVYRIGLRVWGLGFGALGLGVGIEHIDLALPEDHSQILTSKRAADVI